MHHESGRLFLPSTTHVVSSFFKGHACRHRLDGLQRLTERLRASHALRTCTRGLSLSLSLCLPLNHAADGSEREREPAFEESRAVETETWEVVSERDTHWTPAAEERERERDGK